jgi:hypothetical protein
MTAWIKIDWSTVQVTAAGNELFGMTVQLDGSPDDAWRRAFNVRANEVVNRDAPEHVGADWTIAPLAADSISVAGVRPGQEPAVKERLEMLVDDANVVGGSGQEDETDVARQAAQADAMARRLRGDDSG